MKNPIKPLVSTKRRKITTLAAIAGVLAISGTATAMQLNQTTGAEDVPPIVQQVNDHEGRIGNLEQRADVTDEQVGQNTGDIIVLQQASGTPTSPTPNVTQTATTPPTTITPEPVVVPEPEKARDYIVSVKDTPIDEYTHSCGYKVYDSTLNYKIGETIQPVSQACKSVGSRYYQN